MKFLSIELDRFIIIPDNQGDVDDGLGHNKILIYFDPLRGVFLAREPSKCQMPHQNLPLDR